MLFYIDKMYINGGEGLNPFMEFWNVSGRASCKDLTPGVSNHVSVFTLSGSLSSSWLFVGLLTLSTSTSSTWLLVW